MISINLDTPGRLTGSYETPEIESVKAVLIFCAISSVESEIRIRDRGSWCDFDILRWGCVRDMTRFAGDRMVSGSWKMVP